MTTATREEIPIHIELRGGNWDAYNAAEPEILVEGGAGTGKTFGILLKRHQNAQLNPGYRGLIVRKTAVTLAGTVLRTFEEEVLHEWDSASRSSKQDGVHFFGGSQNEPAAYVYDNGSRITVGGMDQATKVLGSDYDEVYENEGTELSLEDHETLLGRLRHGILERRQMIVDCNPSYEAHWLLKRVQSGAMLRIKTTLKDNPAYWQEGDWTPLGREYLARLQAMTGTRYQRFFLGEWVGMENSIYGDLLDASKQLVELPQRVAWTGRNAGGIDYGRIHLSAVVALTEASDGYLWVRECWAKPGGDLQAIEDADRSQRVRFGRRRGVTDPIQEVLAQRLSYKAAKSGAGSRKGRIEMVRKLLANDRLRFDKYGEGMQELWDEMQMYRYEIRETNTVIEDIVVRKDEDRVAALEYAVEALETAAEPLPRRVSTGRREAVGAARSFPHA